MDEASELNPGKGNTMFTRELLAEANDRQLQIIVEEAARDLKTPIALVTLVMEHIQFFKAHYGLPTDLAAARGTDRDISFCQFVVKSNQPLEIKDARGNPDLPQELVDQYDIRAYLGMPITFNNMVVGSLCVLDTKPRSFTDSEKQELKELSELVSDRLESFSQQRKRSVTSLLGQATIPALEEIRSAMNPMHFGINAGHAALKEIQTFLRIAELTAYGKIESKEDILRPLERAKDVLKKYESDLYNMEASLEDAEDSIGAMEQAFRPSTTTLISEIATAGRELARHVTMNTGGVLLPEIDDDLFVSTPRTYGIALVTSVLSRISADLAAASITERIKMEISRDKANAIISFGVNGLGETQFQNLLNDLKVYVSEEPTISMNLAEQKIVLKFIQIEIRS